MYEPELITTIQDSVALTLVDQLSVTTEMTEQALEEGDTISAYRGAVMLQAKKIVAFEIYKNHLFGSDEVDSILLKSIRSAEKTACKIEAEIRKMGEIQFIHHNSQKG